VRFTVLRVLKGTLSASTIEFNGSLENSDDWNDRNPPYTFVRPGGRHGNCFALGYRTGAEYLLFLKGLTLTPYWSPLAPTNEQVSGPSDGWLTWVAAQIQRGVPK